MRVLRFFLATLAFTLLAAPALAFSVTGGTAEQRAYVHEVIDASGLDVARIDAYWLGGFRVQLVEHWEPYWELPPGVDVLYNFAGFARSDGLIAIDSAYLPGYNRFFGEIVAHELTHLDWFIMPAGFYAEWGEMLGGGGTGLWMENRAEAYAEHGKVYAWDAKYIQEDYIRSDLPNVSEADFWAFRARWIQPPAPPEPPAPPVPTTPFSDLVGEDAELIAAAQWAYEAGVLYGFEDGTFRPYSTLTRRHVALIAARSGQAFISGWVFDYSVPTRGVLMDMYPDWQWDSERRDESLLRSQLLRLLYRGRVR